MKISKIKWDNINLTFLATVLVIALSLQMRQYNLNIMTLVFRIVLFLSFTLIIKSQCNTYYEFYDSNSNICKPCAYNCKSCYDAEYCIECMEEYYLDINNNCQKCSFGCAVCSSSTACTTCNDGLYLTNTGSCISCGTGISTCTIAVTQSCQPTYFLLSTICAGCFSNCNTCSDFVSCSSCSLGYYLNSDSTKCLQCSSNCLICTSASLCTSCSQGYTQNNGICQPFNCKSLDPYCIACTSTACLTCEQGKYLNSNQGCSQGGNLLCLQSEGQYHTQCKTSNYGCPQYSQVQYDQYQNQLSICLPFTATKIKEHIYVPSIIYTCQSSCNSPQNINVTYTTAEAFYKLSYYLDIRFYGSQISRNVNVSVFSQGNLLTSDVLTVDISSEYNSFNDIDSICQSCKYVQKLVKGVLSISNGVGEVTFEIYDSSGKIKLKDSLFSHQICQVSYCDSCKSAIDCYSCVDPYFLQLTSCVESCDSGFYVYGKTCYLQCPSGTFTLTSTYSCSACVSPCLTCSDENICITCVSGYFYQNGQCLTQCSNSLLFANTTSNNCESCPNPCRTCYFQNNTIYCQSCVSGYLYQNGKCIFLCPWGQFGFFVNGISQCLGCDSSCGSCYINSTVCSSCSTGYLLLSTDCLSITSCPTSYFRNFTYNKCSSCHYPCRSCEYNSTFCTSCIRGSLFQNTCLNQCPSKYHSNYNDSFNITCEECQSPCSSCVSSYQCISCEIGYFLFQSSCIETCPIGYYNQASNSSCVSCVPPCKICNSSNICLSCTTGYLDGESCTLQCNDTAYVSSNFSCVTCTNPCLNCYSDSYCLKCLLPYLLSGQECITLSSCLSKNGSYPEYIPTSSNYTEIHCSSCSIPCYTCINNSVTCQSCSQGYLYIPNLYKCATNCPSSYYEISNTSCFLCDSSCYQCSITSHNCTSCSAGMYLLSSSNMCMSKCPDNYYGNDQSQICSPCTYPCNLCYNTYLCISCQSGILYMKQCVENCPYSTYYNLTENTCISCSNNCLTCQNSSSICLSCTNGYFLYQQNCISSCPALYFNDEFTRICQSCSSPCLNCSSATSCLSCIAGYYLYNMQCVSACESSYFANNQTNSCDECNSTICLTCQGSAQACLSCNTFNNYYLYKGLCVYTCPNETYANIITGSCDSCPFPCATCLNYTYCLTCQPSYYLFNVRCFSQCPINYYSDSSSNCLLCSENCSICNSPSICISCKTGFYIFNQTCMQSCPNRYYKGVQSITNYDQCISCPINCITCSSYSFCLQCDSTFIQFNGLCLTQCPILYYAVNSSNSFCDSCSQYCKTCVNNTYCLNCIGSYLYENKCIIVCPDGTYPSDGIQCKPCKSPCDNCIGQFTCLTCLVGYIYFHDYCITSCPNDVWYYPSNNTCNSLCPYNKYAEKMICYVGNCGSTMVSFNGYCLEQCSTGYYVNNNQQCILCSKDNQICDNIFEGNLQILRTEALTLVLYFNQQAAIADISDISIKFVDVDNNIVVKNYTNYEITPYQIRIIYDYSSVSLVNITLTIPYVSSKQTSQRISQNSFKKQLSLYQDYSDTTIPSWVSFIPIGLILILFVVIIINVTNKSSHFTQVLDYVQIIAVTLYLNIQYPPILEEFLSGFKASLLIITKNMIDLAPYTYSSPKFIFYNIDTNIFRNSIILVGLFLGLFAFFMVIIAFNTYNKDRFPIIVRIIRYRLINDLFSIFLTPIFLFSCQFLHGSSSHIFMSVLFGLLGIGYASWISYKIIKVKKMSDLQGLLGNFQKTQSKLGLMYTPFGYVRRIVLTLGLGIAPYSPISTLTLIIVTTFLIMICVYFYEPFDNHTTDYVTIFMECSLIFYIGCLIIMALQGLSPQMSFNLGLFIISLVTITFVLCLGWLIYLTIDDIRTKGCCPKAKELSEHHTQNQQYSDSKSQKMRKKEIKEKEEQKRRKLQGTQANQIRIIQNKNTEGVQQSANELLNRFHSKTDELFSKEGEHQDFKHWSDDHSSQKSSDHQFSAAKLPQLLIKKDLNEKIQE